MTITSKRLRGKQRAWALNYEDVTGFEPMYQDEHESREIDFDEFKARNLRWLENYHVETFQSAERGG